MEEIERKVDQPIVKEGVIIREGLEGEPEVVILGFIPSDDQRDFSVNNSTETITFPVQKDG